MRSESKPRPDQQCLFLLQASHVEDLVLCCRLDTDSSDCFFSHDRVILVDRLQACHRPITRVGPGSEPAWRDPGWGWIDKLYLGAVTRATLHSSVAWLNTRFRLSRVDSATCISPPYCLLLEADVVWLALIGVHIHQALPKLGLACSTASSRCGALSRIS
jgi:hypothetical protein